MKYWHLIGFFARSYAHDITHSDKMGTESATGKQDRITRGTTTLAPQLNDQFILQKMEI